MIWLFRRVSLPIQSSSLLTTVIIFYLKKVSVTTASEETHYGWVSEHVDVCYSNLLFDNRPDENGKS